MTSPFQGRPVRKILAIKLRSLGDTVLMTAPLMELRQAFPYAQIDVAVLTPWAPLLQDHPAVNRVWNYDRFEDRAARAKSAARLAIKLRKEHYDCVVNFHASPTSAMVSLATGAKTRSIHFHGHNDKNRYSTVIVPGKGTLKPIIERDMDTVRALGVQVPEGRLPVLQSSPNERSWAADYISQIGRGHAVLALGLGASRPTKAWPLDRFATVAVEWCRQKKGAAIAIGGPSEKKLCSDFLKAVDDVLPNLIPDAAERATVRSRISAQYQFTVRELSAILGAVSLFLGNDSGPKHIAVAKGTSTVTLFGPEHPFEWHPYPQAKNPYFFVESLPCRKDAQPGKPAWCGLEVCVQEQHQCMKLIGTSQVLQKCFDLT
jgi:ADP-heptose:LPS heptosyltransferase